MPEVSVLEKGVEKRIRPWIYPYIPQDRLIATLQGNNLEYIGDGGESVVVSTPEGPDRVRAFTYGVDVLPELAKKQFYYQRVMETLFPHNFPHFYAAFSGTRPGVRYEGSYGGTVRERIVPQKSTKGRRFEQKLGIKNIKFPFSKVIEGCLEMGIPINEMLDTEHGRNFILGEDGGQYYADNLATYYDVRKDPDSLHPLKEPFVSSRDKIADYMRDNGYNDQQKKLVSLCIDRIQATATTGKASKPKVA